MPSIDPAMRIIIIIIIIIIIGKLRLGNITRNGGLSTACL
jgi:hypothetical protein